MDPLSQGIVGAVAAQTISEKINIKAATIMGFLGGMAADVDILFHLSSDKVFGLMMHRHFTHGIGFVPIAALLSYFLAPLFKKWLSRKHVVLFFTAGYMTHGLLDIFTSYGTHFFWPFSNVRVALSTVPIIDPFLTIPLICFVILRAYFKKRRSFTFAAIIWFSAYVGTGFVQNYRATKILSENVKNYQEIHVFPTVGNFTLWRGVIKTAEKIKTVAIKVPFVGKTTKIDGGEVELFKKNPFPIDSVAGKNVEEFRFFCDGLVGINSKTEDLMDMRYAVLPQSNQSLWGLKLPKDSSKNAEFIKYGRGSKKTIKQFLQLIFEDKG